MENLLGEAFQRLSLLEQDFDFSTVDKDKVDELSAFIADDVDEIPEEPIIDVNAEDEEDLADNYIGKVILECECCHTRIYKDENEVVIDDEAGLANIDEACPVCNNSLGYSVIGKIEAFDSDRNIEPEDDAEEEVPDVDADVEDDLGLDAEAEPKEAEYDEDEKEESLKSSKIASDDAKALDEAKLPLKDRIARKHFDSLLGDPDVEEGLLGTAAAVGAGALLGSVLSKNESKVGSAINKGGNKVAKVAHGIGDAAQSVADAFDEDVEIDSFEKAKKLAPDCYIGKDKKYFDKFSGLGKIYKTDNGFEIKGDKTYKFDKNGKSIDEKLTDEEAARMAEITKGGVVRAKDRNEYNDLHKKEMEEELLAHGNEKLGVEGPAVVKDDKSLEDDQAELVHAAGDKIAPINENMDDVCPECGKNPCVCEKCLDEADFMTAKDLSSKGRYYGANKHRNVYNKIANGEKLTPEEHEVAAKHDNYNPKTGGRKYKDESLIEGVEDNFSVDGFKATIFNTSEEDGHTCNSVVYSKDGQDLIAIDISDNTPEVITHDADTLLNYYMKSEYNSFKQFANDLKKQYNEYIDENTDLDDDIDEAAMPKSQKKSLNNKEEFEEAFPSDLPDPWGGHQIKEAAEGIEAEIDDIIRSCTAPDNIADAVWTSEIIQGYGISEDLSDKEVADIACKLGYDVYRPRNGQTGYFGDEDDYLILANPRETIDHYVDATNREFGDEIGEIDAHDFVPYDCDVEEACCNESLKESVQVHADGESTIDVVKNDDGSLSVNVGGEGEELPMEGAIDAPAEEPGAEEIVPLDADDQAAIEANEPEAEEDDLLGGDEFAEEPLEDEFAEEPVEGEEEEEAPFESLKGKGKPSINEAKDSGLSDQIEKEQLKQMKIQTKMMKMDLEAKKAEMAPAEEVVDEPIEEPAEEPVEDEEVTEESLQQNAGADILEKINSFDEDKFNGICEEYLHRVYSNVNTFKTSKVSMGSGKAIIEGVITFNSGKTKSTTFNFSYPEITKRGKLVMEGYNKTFSEAPRAFRLKSAIDSDKAIAESMIYNYTSKQINESNKQEVVRIYGRIKA